MFFENLLRGILGVTVILVIAVAVSNNRRRINWRTVGAGLGLQILLAIFILKGKEMGAVFAPLGWPRAFFSWVSSFFVIILNFTTEGATFIFGNLAIGEGQPGSMGSFFAFQVLPTIIFFSALMSILYYIGLMQWIVRGMGWAMSRILGTSGAESLSVTADIFVGQTEAPLVVRPFLGRLTNSELLAVMSGGMATIAGGVMAAYIQMLGSSFAAARNISVQAAQLTFAEHLLGASVMAAPAALLLAKMIVPEVEEPETKGFVKLNLEKNGQNLIDAAAIGAADGLKLALNVGGMLIAFIAIVAMFNWLLGETSGLFGYTVTLQQVFGWILAPIAWLIGIPWQDAMHVGSLIGSKIVLNEFVAYLELSKRIAEGAILPRSVIMATYALCGFANFSSIAIQIGGIGPLAPERTSDIARLGLRAVLAGTLANMMTATIAGVLVS